MKVKISTNEDSNKVLLSSKIFEKYNLISDAYLNLKLGIWQKKVQIIPHHDRTKSEVCLPNEIIEDVNLPLNLEYEIALNHNEMTIGPILGILKPGTKSSVSLNKLDMYKSYLTNYYKINGLVLLFTFDGIIFDENKVHGFAYDPVDNDWIEGIYTFPSAIFTRKNLNLRLNNQLTKLIGNRFFNAYSFNKWEMYQWISQIQSIHLNLPKTVILDKTQLKEMLDQYKRVFVKPIWGMKGLGIYEIIANNKDYEIKYRAENSNKTELFSDYDSLYESIVTKTKNRTYIVQQYIKLIEIENRKVDFRAIMQKEEDSKWRVQGIITRYGSEDSIVSNISNGGTAEKTWDTFVRYFKDKNLAFDKWLEIKKFAFSICEGIEKSGFLYGNLGLDIGMDTDYKIWLIEINNRNPDPTIAFDANDDLLYYKLRSNPLKYAKWLSGFR